MYFKQVRAFFIAYVYIRLWYTYLLLLLSCATVDVGRVDIAKRLKYTKDIMYRLINTQTK